MTTCSSNPRRHVRALARSRRAFSLLEIMLVVVIIGLLMSVAAWNMIGAGNKARITTTKARMKQIETALNSYQLEKGAYPATLVVLTTGSAAILKEDGLTDGWRRPIAYYVPGPAGKAFGLVSNGPDGESGTADDIDFWTMDKE